MIPLAVFAGTAAAIPLPRDVIDVITPSPAGRTLGIKLDTQLHMPYTTGRETTGRDNMLPGYFWDSVSLAWGFFTVVLFGGTILEIERMKTKQRRLECEIYNVVNSTGRERMESAREEAEPQEADDIDQ